MDTATTAGALDFDCSVPSAIGTLAALLVSLWLLMLQPAAGTGCVSAAYSSSICRSSRSGCMALVLLALPSPRLLNYKIGLVFGYLDTFAD
eukprot:2389714-Amphidinium_carterae.2